MKIKEMGQVFTPLYIVEFMLNQIGYTQDKKIYEKIICEPSAGDGAFISSIVPRIISSLKEHNKLDKVNILNSISNIHAFELDQHHYKNLILNTVSVVMREIKSHGYKKEDIKSKDIQKILEKNFINTDTLKFKNNIKYDYIVGNPPYVRLHNLEKDNLKYLRENYSTMKTGSVDLYFSFYEWSLNNISENGLITLITPNAFLVNNSGKKLREILAGNIKSIYNFQSIQIFENASTYNLISILMKNSPNMNAYFPTITNSKVKIGEKKKVTEINGKLIISKNNWIEEYMSEKKPSLDFKNGLATLSDDIFITSDFKKINENYIFKGNLIEGELIREIVKVSTSFTNNKKRVAIFPYKIIDKNILPLTEEEMKKYPNAYKYLSKHKSRLESRSLDSNSTWFTYGRSQALNSILVNKVILKTLIKNEIQYSFVPKGKLVYSGLYSEYTNKNETVKFLDDERFVKYLFETGQDKRGDYKMTNSTAIRELINGK